MHYEILVEGQCELTALSIILPSILGAYAERNTWKIHKHQGIGSIPENPETVNPKDRTLLGQLPAKINAYNAVPNPNRTVIVLMDLDQNNKDTLLGKLNLLIPQGSEIKIEFCFAIEELEAWFLGDQAAIVTAYPNSKLNIHRTYIQDSICGTWETLADIIESTIKSLPKRDQRVLKEKCEWAKKIPPHMDVNKNSSPSFILFRNALLGTAS